MTSCGRCSARGNVCAVGGRRTEGDAVAHAAAAVAAVTSRAAGAAHHAPLHGARVINMVLAADECAGCAVMVSMRAALFASMR